MVVINMIDYKIVAQVKKKKKPLTGILRKVMVILGVIFILMESRFHADSCFRASL